MATMSMTKYKFYHLLSPSFMSLVDFAHWCRGFAVFGPGPDLPAHLLLLALLPKMQEGRPVTFPFALPSAHCRLLLHRVVRHHRHASLQVRG